MILLPSSLVGFVVVVVVISVVVIAVVVVIRGQATRSQDQE